MRGLLHVIVIAICWSLVRPQVVYPISEQIANTSWVFINCDPTTNQFETQFFSAFSQATNFEFSAACDGTGNLVPDPAGINNVAPLSTQTVVFTGIQDIDDSGRFSIDGQTCQFILSARVLNPLNNIVTYSFITIDVQTVPCGAQSQQCDCHFFDVFCWIDGCNAQYSAFFWICIYFIEFAAAMIAMVIYEWVKVRKENKLLGKVNSHQAVINENMGSRSKKVNGVIKRLRSGETTPAQLRAEWQEKMAFLNDKDNAVLMREHAMDVIQNQREAAMRAKTKPGFFDSFRGIQSARAQYSGGYLGPGDHTIEMQDMNGNRNSGLGRDPNSQLWNGGKQSGGVFRRPRVPLVEEDRSQRQNQLQALLDTDTDY